MGYLWSDPNGPNSKRDIVQKMATEPNLKFGPYHPGGREAVQRSHDIQLLALHVLEPEVDDPPTLADLKDALKTFRKDYIPSVPEDGQQYLIDYADAMDAMIEAGPHATALPSGKPTVGETDGATDGATDMTKEGKI